MADDIKLYHIPDETPPLTQEDLQTAIRQALSAGSYIGSQSGVRIISQGFDVGQQGQIRGGQTDYNTGTGWFLGYSGGAYKFSIGDATSNYITWDGSALSIVGGFKLSKVFTAFEAIAAGAPVGMWFNGSNVPVYDNSASGTSSAASTTVSVSYTCTGTNRILIVFVSDSGAGVTGITYNGVAMTQEDTLHTNQNKSFYLIAPASGSNTLTFTKDLTATINYIVYSYTGAKQSGQPAAHNAQVATSSSVTPSADGEVVVGCAFTVDVITSTTGIANHTKSLAVGGAYAMASGDSGGVQGGLSYTVTETGGTGCAIFTFSIALATAVSLDGSYCTNASSAVAGYKSKLVGFANAAIAAGAQGAVVLQGVVTSLSGLTPGSYYYLNDAVGTIGTSAGTVSIKVGFALTSSQLLITNIW
jgi:hypothetical protein